MAYSQADGQLQSTGSLPSDESEAALDPIKVGESGTTLDADFRLSVDALDAGELPDGEEVRYRVESAPDTSFEESQVEIEQLLTQAADESGGAPAVQKRFRLPSTAHRFVRVVAEPSSSEDKSASAMTVSMLF